MPRGKGPPKLLDAEPFRSDRVLQILTNGGTVADAATAAGVTRQTVNNYRRARPEFDMKVKQAIVKGKHKLISVILNAAGEGSWKAAAWWLERRFPEFARRERHEVTGRHGGPIKTETEHKHTIDYDAIESELRAIGGRMAARTAADDRG